METIQNFVGNQEDWGNYITNVEYTSKEQALKEGTKELGANPAEFAGENPFTAEIELRLKANYANNDSIKKIAADLKKYADWSKVLSTVHLERSQLPDKIPGTALWRPDSWK